MIHTYQTKDVAIGAIPEFCGHKEQDIFVYRVVCPSCEEFSLRTRDEIMSEDSPQIVHKYYLPMEHHFKDRDNAVRESAVWESRLGVNVDITRHYKQEGGYQILSHYTLKI